MIEWELISSPSSAPAPSTGAWSMVDNSLDHPKIVFPPVNHEGLDQIFSSASSPYTDVKEINIERAVPPPSTLSTARQMMPTIKDATREFWVSGIELLRIKIAGIVSTFRKFAAGRRFSTSFRSQPGNGLPLAGAIMVLLLYLGFRRRRGIQRENISDLICIVREKDEEMLQKLNELLHEVTRMNEVLLALASQHGARAATP